MCVVIIEGTARQLDVELGVDYSAHWEGSVEDADFIKKNTGPGKRFPGGPTCKFQGKEVPFVQYINHPTTKYCVSIGVPYGTSFWQVGDSKEQNGCFKIATYRVKEEIMQERENLMMDTVGILPSDIMIIVKRSWDKSFARVEQNRKAIAERGWYPYNRNLLKNEEIRITMTEKESQEDMFLNMDRISSASSSSPSSSISELTDPSFDSFCTQGNSLVNRHGIKPTTLNLSSGMGMHVLKSIVRESDLAKAREEIEQQKKDGIRKKTLLKDMKKITAGNMVRCGEFVIGKPIEEWIYEKEMERRKLDEEKQERMKARLEARALEDQGLQNCFNVCEKEK